jgi:hypothetical protein
MPPIVPRAIRTILPEAASPQNFISSASARIRQAFRTGSCGISQLDAGRGDQQHAAPPNFKTSKQDFLA